jgi:hypothetical protein
MLKGPGMTNAENGLHLCEINIISKYVTIIWLGCFSPLKHLQSYMDYSTRDMNNHILCCLIKQFGKLTQIQSLTYKTKIAF